MVAEGQEFARSKVIAPTEAPDPNVGKLDHNSYEKDNDTNYLNYGDAVWNRDLVEYYRGLIHLRRAHLVFGSAQRSAIGFLDTGDDFAIAYELTGSAAGNASESFVVILNGNPDRQATRQ